MGNKDKNKEKESAINEASINDAPSENAGAEKNETKSSAESSKNEKDNSPTASKSSSKVSVDEARYKQLNRVALSYGMRKTELNEFFKREVSEDINIINHTQNPRQVKYKIGDVEFPKEGYYSCK